MELYINQNVPHTNVYLTVIFVPHSVYRYTRYNCKALSHIKLSNVLNYYNINHHVLYNLITLFLQVT